MQGPSLDTVPVTKVPSTFPEYVKDYDFIDYLNNNVLNGFNHSTLEGEEME